MCSACLPVRILAGFFQDFARTLPAFARMLPGFLQDSAGFCQDFARIFPGFCQNSARIFSEFSQDIARIVPGFSQDFVRNLMGFRQHSPCLPACVLASCLLAWLRACSCLPAWLPACALCVFVAACLGGWLLASCLLACASSSLRVFIVRKNDPRSHDARGETVTTTTKWQITLLDKT